MKQLTLNDFGLDWLSTEWTPQKVTIFRGRVENEESKKRFDDYFAMSCGYDNINHMNKYNYDRDMQRAIIYGDKEKGLI